MRALLITWGATLTLMLGGGLYLQFSYEPPSEILQVDNQVAVDSEGDESELIDGALSTGQSADGLPENNDAGAMPESIDQSGVSADQGIDDGVPVSDEGVGTELPNATVSNSNASKILAPSDPFLQEEGPHGPLPMARNSRQPWQVYAREFTGDPNRPRVAIVLTGLGLNKTITESAIQNLPGEVALAFSPYANELDRYAELARRGGHETLLMVPMEPLEYPLHDPGPHTLLATASANANLDKLHFVMSRTKGYVGLINEMGSKFSATEEAVRPIMADLQGRGLLFVDGRSNRFSLLAKTAQDFGVPRAVNNRFIDTTITEEAILRELRALEDVARSLGAAVGVGHAYPITVSQISRWAEELSSRGVVLVPVTAVANRQPVPQGNG